MHACVWGIVCVWGVYVCVCVCMRVSEEIFMMPIAKEPSFLPPPKNRPFKNRGKNNGRIFPNKLRTFFSFFPTPAASDMFSPPHSLIRHGVKSKTRMIQKAGLFDRKGKVMGKKKEWSGVTLEKKEERKERRRERRRVINNKKVNCLFHTWGT